MPAPLSGPGLGLPLPQNLYPSELNNAPYDFPGNRQALAPGESLVLPAGDWYVSLGMYLVIQFLDPFSNTWNMGSAASWSGGHRFVKSDGFNMRVANLTGCPVSASIANYGAGGYVQSSTTITANIGGSLWAPIIGGQLALSGGTLTASGAGYGVAPLVFIQPPPPPANNANGVGGVPASGYCTIASGTISGFTFTNPGAGYPSAPVGVIVPSPFDPNLSSGITAGSITFSLTGSGSLTGALCTNNGAALAGNQFSSLTLTVAGAGTQATLTPNILQTVVTASLAGTGLGWGTVTGMITSVGGAPAAGTITNGPEYNHLAWRPRPAQISAVITALGTVANQIGTIIDGGLFESAPTPIQLPGAQAGQSGSIVGSTITFTMGSVTDIAVIQQAP